MHVALTSTGYFLIRGTQSANTSTNHTD